MANTSIVSASIYITEGFADIIPAISHWKFKNIETSLFLPPVIPDIIAAALTH